MQVYVSKITGIDDALVSMLMSKRSWTIEKEQNIRNKCAYILDSTGKVKAGIAPQEVDWFASQMQKLFRYGVVEKHTTLIRYIDVTITIEGLHRGGQDDLDAHAERMDNRIVRASTRLGKFEDGEMSEYYQDKIMLPFQALLEAGLDVPDRITARGQIFIKTDYGYIREDIVTDEEWKGEMQDVKRGLYPISIPSNCIFKIQIPDLAHIYQFRCMADGHAHPELQEAVEGIYAGIKEIQPQMGQWLEYICTDKPLRTH